MEKDINEILANMPEREQAEWFYANRGILLTFTVRCAHCGRTCCDFAGGYAVAQGKFVCHPNAAGRPDCYRLITVYGEELGARSKEGKK